jgi:hypothetical protein
MMTMRKIDVAAIAAAAHGSISRISHERRLETAAKP